MSLPTVSDLKGYLRIETAAEDADLTRILAQATARVKTFLEIPIEAAELTGEDDAWDEEVYGVITQLLVPWHPFDPESLVITDANGDEVDSETYTIPDPINDAIVRAKPGIAFPSGPYTFTADVGWDLHPNFATEIEPLINSAIIDLASDIYNKRSPDLASESESGISMSFKGAGVPDRVKSTLMPLKQSAGPL